MGELMPWQGPLHAGWEQTPEWVWKVNKGNAKCSTGKAVKYFLLQEKRMWRENSLLRNKNCSLYCTKARANNMHMAKF